MKNLMHRAHAEFLSFRQMARDLLANKSGASMIEYSILIGLITAAVIVTIGLVGDKVVIAWTTLESNWTMT